MPAGIPTSVAELPVEVPVFPLIGVILLPRGYLPLHVFEPRYLAMVDAALTADRVLAIAQPQAFAGTSGQSVDDTTPLQRVGCCGRIINFRETSDGRLHIGLRGLCRLSLAEEVPSATQFRRFHADYSAFAGDLAPPAPNTGTDTSIDRIRLVAALTRYAAAANIDADWDSLAEAADEELVTTVAMACPFAPEDKQALLESSDLHHRTKLLIGLVEAASGPDPVSTTKH